MALGIGDPFPGAGEESDILIRPGALTRLLDIPTRDVPLTVGVAELILRANPNRIGFFFAADPAAGGLVNVGPWSDLATYRVATVNTSQFVMITTADVYVLTCREWWALTTINPTTLRVGELIRTI